MAPDSGARMCDGGYAKPSQSAGMSFIPDACQVFLIYKIVFYIQKVSCELLLNPF